MKCVHFSPHIFVILTFHNRWLTNQFVLILPSFVKLHLIFAVCKPFGNKINLLKQKSTWKTDKNENQGPDC